MNYLRITEIQLKDGQTYKFRQLPMTEETAELLKVLMGDDVDLSVIIKAIRKSLSYDQSKEVIDGLFENGVITPKDDLEKIMGAMLG